MKIRKNLSLILMVLFSVTLLSGCSNENNIIESDQTVVMFSWWGNDTRHSYTMDGVDLFQEMQNVISVQYRYGEWSGYERKNRVWMESHTEADIMQINYAWIKEYSEDGNGYYDLNQLLDYIDLSSYEESDLEFGMVDGKLNAIPIAFNMSSLCFNKEIFESHGVSYPKNWDELLTVGRVLAQDGIYTIGMAKKHLLLMLMAYYEQTCGQKVFNEDGSFLLDKNDLGYILDFYKMLIDENILMPVENFDRSKFGNGECAGSVFWVSDADNYCGALEKNGYTPEFVPYFMADGALLSGLYMKPATMYAISSITENPEAAAQVLNFLINNDEMILLQGTEKGVPANEHAVELLLENDMLNSYGFSAYQQMQSDRDKLNIMIPEMESESLIDAFKLNADAYIYDVSDRESTIDIIYDEMTAVMNSK